VRTAEYQIREAVLKYNKWALRDGDIENTWNGLSLFDTISARKHVSSKVVEAKMLQKLGKLAAKWQEAFHERQIQDYDNLNNGKSCAMDFESGPELPTLYGVISLNTIMAFVSYDVHAAKPMLRTVAMFEFANEGYDVWNSLAVAIFVVHCRNRMFNLQDCLPEREDRSSETDPDV
jgi:hypothetical protein